MLSINEQYISDIKRAICKYQARFHDPNDIPTHRANDISKIEGILIEEGKSIEARNTAIERYLMSIKTGWWIFHTKKSYLRDCILEIVQTYRNSIITRYILDAEENAALIKKQQAAERALPVLINKAPQQLDPVVEAAKHITWLIEHKGLLKNPALKAMLEEMMVIEPEHTHKILFTTNKEFTPAPSPSHYSFKI